MSIPVSIVEVARNLGIGFMLTSWPFIVFDSLNKRVDVVDLKSKLDLCVARHMSIVIKVMEASLAPLIGTDLRSVDVDFDFRPDGERVAISPQQNLSDTAKDALGVALRRCDKILVRIYEIRCVPERVRKLNGRVYGGALSIALVATVVTGCCFFWPEMPRKLAWIFLASLALSFITTGYFAVTRHRQVQDAEQAIVDEDPQPRV